MIKRMTHRRMTHWLQENNDEEHEETETPGEEAAEHEFGAEEITVEPEIGFGAGSQNLGLAGLEPKGAGTSTIDISVDGNTKQLNIQMNEAVKLLKEISMGLANKAANIAYDKAYDTQENDPLASRKANQQGNMFKKNINPELQQELDTLGITAIRNGEVMMLDIPSIDGAFTGLKLKVYPTSYNIESGSQQEVDQSLLRRLSNLIKRIQADLSSQVQPEPAPNELEEAQPMNESERKVRAYVRKRLEENSGLRKPSLNESAKSEKMKQLDKLIDTQFEAKRKKK